MFHMIFRLNYSNKIFHTCNFYMNEIYGDTKSISGSFKLNQYFMWNKKNVNNDLGQNQIKDVSWFILFIIVCINH